MIGEGQSAGTMCSDRGVTSLALSLATRGIGTQIAIPHATPIVTAAPAVR